MELGGLNAVDPLRPYQKRNYWYTIVTYVWACL